MNRRVSGLIRKEILQVLRDPSSIAIAFLLPAALLLLFGYGVSMDAKDLRLGIVIEQSSTEASSFAGAFQQSRYFKPQLFATRQQAQQAMKAKRLDGVLVLAGDFAKRLKGEGDAPIQLIVNGVDANTARLMEGYARGTWERWLERELSARAMSLTKPVEIQPRIWFNPELRSRNYLVPGLVAINMTLVGALLTALVMAREWERGTLEALMVTPVTLREMLIGKILPYFILGMGGMAISVSMAIWQFDVPLRGSLWVLLLCSALFLLVALGMGLLISVVAKSQFVAGMIAIVTTFLPAFLLSGFLFDIDSMPLVVQGITHIVAARYFIAILQSLFLAGNLWEVILPNALALLVMGLVFYGLVRKKLHKRLD
ncbi:MAG: ABC transporter permease [Candidatus Thiodiazotropha sp.]